MAKTSEERIGINETEIINLKDSDIELKKTDDKQWSEIGEIRKFMHRLVPVWVTVVLMVSSAITGSALTFAGMIIKFSK